MQSIYYYVNHSNYVKHDCLRSQPLPLASALPPGVEENEGCRGGGSRLGGSCWVRSLTSKCYRDLNWNNSQNIFPGPAEGSWEQEWEWWKPAQSPRRTLIPSECLFRPYISLCVFVFLYHSNLSSNSHFLLLPLPSLPPSLTAVRVQSLDLMYFCQNTRLTVSMQIKTHLFTWYTNLFFN